MSTSIRKKTSIENLEFRDDFMFGAVLKNSELCKSLLEEVLDMKIEKIEYISTQRVFDIDYESHGIRLDVFLRDANNTVYNVEMQRTNHHDMPKRSRWYQGIMDLGLLEKGLDYNSLDKAIIIFFCDFDPFNKSRYRYSFEQRCEEELDLRLGDETRKIFLNTTGTFGNISDTLKEVLKFINEPKIKTNNPLVEQIAEEVKKVKVNPERRREFMTYQIRLAEERTAGRVEGRVEGRAEGEKEAKRQVALKMLKDGIPVENIAKYSGLTEAEVSEIKINMSN